MMGKSLVGAAAPNHQTLLKPPGHSRDTSATPAQVSGTKYWRIICNSEWGNRKSYKVIIFNLKLMVLTWGSFPAAPLPKTLTIQAPAEGEDGLSLGLLAPRPSQGPSCVLSSSRSAVIEPPYNPPCSHLCWHLYRKDDDVSLRSAGRDYRQKAGAHLRWLLLWSSSLSFPSSSRRPFETPASLVSQAAAPLSAPRKKQKGTDIEIYWNLKALSCVWKRLSGKRSNLFLPLSVRSLDAIKFWFGVSVDIKIPQFVL